MCTERETEFFVLKRKAEIQAQAGCQLALSDFLEVAGDDDILIEKLESLGVNIGLRKGSSAFVDIGGVHGILIC